MPTAMPAPRSPQAMTPVDVACRGEVWRQDGLAFGRCLWRLTSVKRAQLCSYVNGTLAVSAII